MALFNGDDKILYLYVGSTWVPIGCATGHSFSEQVDLLDLNIDGWAASVPTNQGYEISFTGIQISSIPGTHSYDEIKLIKRAKTLIQWKIQDINTGERETGHGFIISISEAAPAGDLLTFEGAILGFSTISETLAGDALWQDGDGILFQDGVEMAF